MVTEYPQPLVRPQTTPDPRPSLGDIIGQFLCGLTGHDTFMHFEDERLSLRCVSCGHETPGWELNETPPTVTQRST